MYILLKTLVNVNKKRSIFLKSFDFRIQNDLE